MQLGFPVKRFEEDSSRICSEEKDSRGFPVKDSSRTDWSRIRVRFAVKRHYKKTRLFAAVLVPFSGGFEPPQYVSRHFLNSRLIDSHKLLAAIILNPWYHSLKPPQFSAYNLWGVKVQKQVFCIYRIHRD